MNNTHTIISTVNINNTSKPFNTKAGAFVWLLTQKRERERKISVKTTTARRESNWWNRRFTNHLHFFSAVISSDFFFSISILFSVMRSKAAGWNDGVGFFFGWNLFLSMFVYKAGKQHEPKSQANFKSRLTENTCRSIMLYVHLFCLHFGYYLLWIQSSFQIYYEI